MNNKGNMSSRNGPGSSHQGVLEEIDEEDDGGVKPENQEAVSSNAQNESAEPKKQGGMEEKERKKHRVHPTMQNLPIVRSSSSSSLSKAEAVEKYYERNAHTVSGAHKNQDTLGKLQRRYKPKQDGVSVLSSPGALGEPIVPTRRHFDISMYWFAFHRKQIGLRHIMVVLMVLSYTVFGAFVFWGIESRYEKAVTLERVTKLEKLLTELSINITTIVNDPNITTTESEMKVHIREAYVTLMRLEGQYKGSTYYKLEDHGRNWKWTFESAFFFSMNVYTTTGYGSIAPESTLGQFLVCLYGFIFVPVTLVALRDLGQFFLVHLTKFYAHLIQRFRELNGDRNVDVNEIIKIPIKACLLLLVLYLAFCTIFIHIYDELSGDGSGTGMSMFLCFYFSFISLSTIGLGDVMPNNATFSPIISIMFFFGMALTKVVNRNTFIAVENGIFGMLTLVENKLDGIVRKGKTMPEEDKPPKSPPIMQRAMSVEDYVAAHRENTNEVMNNFTVRSIATFMKSNADIYGGGFGRVQLRRGDLMGSDHQMTTMSTEKEATAPAHAHSDGEDKGYRKSRGRDRRGHDSDYYSDRSLSRSRSRERVKGNIVEDLLSAIGVLQSKHKDDRSHSRSAGASGPEDEARKKKTREALQAALTAAAMEAFRTRKDGKITPQRLMQIAGAAIAAGGLDVLVEKAGSLGNGKSSGEGGSMRSLIESVVGGLATSKTLGGKGGKHGARGEESLGAKIGSGVVNMAAKHLARSLSQGPTRRKTTRY